MDDGDESTLASLADVYCTGELLAAVQRAGIWPDSKDFVDTAIKAGRDADDVRRAWRARSSPENRDGRPMTDDEVREFVAEYFERGPERPVEGGEVDVDAARATLPDWDPDGPAFAHDIADPTLRDFARRVHALWPSLARPPPPASPHTKPRSTLLPSPRVAIVPGERFRETYYWDTHWTVLGLLASGMRRSASGVCENMLTLVDTHGFMPNGARVYYLNRSQPPVLASTVAAVCGVKGDDYDAALATRALPTLISEWEYLTRPERTVRVRSRRDPSATHRMYRYWAYTDEPRPESWREDTDLIENQPPAIAKRISRDVASAAESGHDFGSRWLADAGTNEVPPGTTSDGDVAVDVASLRSIRTTRVVPADLNGFMLKTAVDISATASAVGDGDAAARFEREAARIRAAIAEVLWDGETGRWRDLLLRDWDGCIGDSGDFSEDEAIRDDSGYVPGVRASDWIPLWCGAVDAGSQHALNAVDALRISGLVLPGGIATSLAHTGHQWDYPNAWAPLVHSLCDGCERYGGVKGAALARDVAVRWVRGCATLMERTGYMHEKYDARVAGTRAGGGGEYTPQRGFGWSNGVALYFLWKYLAGPSSSDGEVHHSESTHSLPDGVMRP